MLPLACESIREQTEDKQELSHEFRMIDKLSFANVHDFVHNVISHYNKLTHIVIVFTPLYKQQDFTAEKFHRKSLLRKCPIKTSYFD